MPRSSQVASRSGRSARTPLTRNGILQVALTIVDEGGPGALTFRRVADRLGVDPMAVYYHVPGKAELQDGVAELVMQGLGSLPAGGSWVERLRSSLIEYRRCVLAHPRAIALTLSRASLPEPMLQAAELQLQALDDAGLDGPDADRWYRVLASYVNGFLATESAPRQADGTPLPSGEVERRMAEFTDSRPRLRVFAERLLAADTDASFLAGLDSLLARVATEAAQARKRAKG